MEIALVTQKAWAADGYIVVPNALIEHTGVTPAEQNDVVLVNAPVIAKIEACPRQVPQEESKEGGSVDVSKREEEKEAGWRPVCNV